MKGRSTRQSGGRPFIYIKEINDGIIHDIKGILRYIKR